MNGDCDGGDGEATDESVRSKVQQLYGLAERFAQRQGRWLHCDCLIRAQPAAYFQALETGVNRQGQLCYIEHEQLKDSVGHEWSPINGRLEGLRFAVGEEADVKASTYVSVYGDTAYVRNWASGVAHYWRNLYFADFYCARGSPLHTVLLVVTHKYSCMQEKQVRLCEQYLTKLDWETNPFLTHSPDTGLYYVRSSKYLCVEVYSSIGPYGVQKRSLQAVRWQQQPHPPANIDPNCAVCCLEWSADQQDGEENDTPCTSSSSRQPPPLDSALLQQPISVEHVTNDELTPRHKTRLSVVDILQIADKQHRHISHRLSQKQESRDLWRSARVNSSNSLHTEMVAGNMETIPDNMETVPDNMETVPDNMETVPFRRPASADQRRPRRTFSLYEQSPSHYLHSRTDVQLNGLDGPPNDPDAVEDDRFFIELLSRGLVGLGPRQRMQLLIDVQKLIYNAKYGAQTNAAGDDSLSWTGD